MNPDITRLLEIEHRVDVLHREKEWNDMKPKERDELNEKVNIELNSLIHEKTRLILKLENVIGRITTLKNTLEAFDMNRDNGILPDNWEALVDEIASIVWDNKKHD
jgi:hypothetical protein